MVTAANCSKGMIPASIADKIRLLTVLVAL